MRYHRGVELMMQVVVSIVLIATVNAHDRQCVVVVPVLMLVLVLGRGSFVGRVS